jgi:hypothetical protein
MDEHGRILEVLDRKPETRRIKIKLLTPDKDLAQMSEDIIEKCKFIHPSRKEEIEQLLIKLRKYQIAHPPKSEAELAAETSAKEAEESKDARHRTRSRGSSGDSRSAGGGGGGGGGERERERRPPPEERLPDAHIEELDDYLELLYQVGHHPIYVISTTTIIITTTTTTTTIIIIINSLIG